MTRRLVPNGNGKVTTIKVNGRSYTCALGVSIDVADSDAIVLEANGWVAVADGVGTTAQRPATPGPRFLYHDTTLGYTVVWEGAAWRNPATGASV